MKKKKMMFRRIRIMNRNCEKCIYHISGNCSAWNCKMTTLEDYKAEVIDRFAEVLRTKIKEEIDDCADELEWIDKIAEQLKAGGK
jgi:hypothetical protein